VFYFVSMPLSDVSNNILLSSPSHNFTFRIELSKACVADALLVFINFLKNVCICV